MSIYVPDQCNNHTSHVSPDHTPRFVSFRNSIHAPCSNTRIWPILVLVIACTVVALLSILTNGSPAVLGVTTNSLAGDSLEVTWVMPGGYGAEAGLLAGDVVRLIEEPQEAKDRYVIEVTRAGITRKIIIDRKWPMASDYILFGVGLEFLIAGSLVYWRAADRPAASRFLLLSAVVAITLVTFPGVASGSYWALALKWFGLITGMACFVLYFLNKPVKRWRPLRLFFFWTPFLIMAIYCFVVFVQPALYIPFKILGYVYMALAMIVSLVAMVFALFGGSRERSQMWPFLLALILPSLFCLICSVIPFVVYHQYLIAPQYSLVGLGLIPVAFVWVLLYRPILGKSLESWVVARTVVDTISDPVFVLDKEMRLIEANVAAQKLIDARELKDAVERFQKRLKEYQNSSPERAVEIASWIDRLCSGQVLSEEEIQFSVPGSIPVWMSISATPIRNEREEMTMVVVVCRDNSERHEREEERTRLLRAEQEVWSKIEKVATRNEAILAQIADAVILVDTEGNPTYLNKAAQRLIGFTEMQAALSYYLGESGREITGKVTSFKGEPATMPYGNVPKTISDPQEVVNSNFCLHRPDGTDVFVALSINPIFTDKRDYLGIVITLRDVTESVELERQKDEFLSNVSHDLRTPLTSIKFAVGAILANEPADISPPIRTLLRNIDISTDRMVSLVDDLLELSKLQAGRVQLRTYRCDLRDMAYRCVSAIEPMLLAKHQRLEMDMPSESCVVEIDTQHIERAVINLLSNANKYGRESGLIRLVLRCEGTQALLGIYDDGVGIPQNELSKVFERFYRSNRSNVIDRTGNGLGLAIARGLVELHGGQVWLESDVGNGSSAWMALPLAGLESALIGKAK